MHNSVILSERSEVEGSTHWQICRQLPAPSAQDTFFDIHLPRSFDCGLTPFAQDDKLVSFLILESHFVGRRLRRIKIQHNKGLVTK